MNDKEFALEALKRLIPDTTWWSETNHDSKSLDNLDLLSDMIDLMIESLVEYSAVPVGNKGNGSYEAISKKKRKIMKMIRDYLDECLGRRCTPVDISEVLGK